MNEGLRNTLRRVSLRDIVSDAAARFDARPSYRASIEARLELGLTGSETMAMVRACTTRIDLNGKTAPEKACPSKSVAPWVHHIIVRADLPVGWQVAQSVHAAGESASPRPQPGCIAVALHARDEAHLREIAQRLFDAGIEHHCVFECDDDPDYPGQMMSIGLYPTRDRAKVRKVLSSLPLVK